MKLNDILVGQGWYTFGGFVAIKINHPIGLLTSSIRDNFYYRSYSNIDLSVKYKELFFLPVGVI